MTQPLEFETTNHFDAIERIVCEPMQKAAKVEMSKDDTIMLFKLLKAGKNSGVVIPEAEKPFLYQLIEKRLQLFTYNITDNRLILFLTVISQTPGKAVLYMWYLQYWAYKHKVDDIDLDYFCKNIFPMGFPSNQSLKQIWDSQKLKRPKDYDPQDPPGDNLVDYALAGGSILNLPF